MNAYRDEAPDPSTATDDHDAAGGPSAAAAVGTACSAKQLEDLKLQTAQRSYNQAEVCCPSLCYEPSCDMEVEVARFPSRRRTSAAGAAQSPQRRRTSAVGAAQSPPALTASAAAEGQWQRGVPVWHMLDEKDKARHAAVVLDPATLDVGSAVFYNIKYRDCDTVKCVAGRELLIRQSDPAGALPTSGSASATSIALAAASGRGQPEMLAWRWKPGVLVWHVKDDRQLAAVVRGPTIFGVGSDDLYDIVYPRCGSVKCGVPSQKLRIRVREGDPPTPGSTEHGRWQLGARVWRMEDEDHVRFPAVVVGAVLYDAGSDGRPKDVYAVKYPDVDIEELSVPGQELRSRLPGDDPPEARRAGQAAKRHRHVRFDLGANTVHEIPARPEAEQEAKISELSARMAEAEVKAAPAPSSAPRWVCPDCDEINRAERLQCNNCERAQPPVAKAVVHKGKLARTRNLNAGPVYCPIDVDDTDLPSVGSAWHRINDCKPCGFHFKGTCWEGKECNHCHICGEKEYNSHRSLVRCSYPRKRQPRRRRPSRAEHLSGGGATQDLLRRGEEAPLQQWQ